MRTNQSSKAANAMGLFPLLFLLLLLPNLSTSCCCSYISHGGVVSFFCGCNIFGCNCATDTCTYNDGTTRSGMCQCDNEEHCPSRRRKRSLDEPISQAYSGLYPRNLIAEPAMENFFSFDLNAELRIVADLTD